MKARVWVLVMAEVELGRARQGVRQESDEKATATTAATMVSHTESFM